MALPGRATCVLFDVSDILSFSVYKICLPVDHDSWKGGVEYGTSSKDGSGDGCDV